MKLHDNIQKNWRFWKSKTRICVLTDRYRGNKGLKPQFNNKKFFYNIIYVRMRIVIQNKTYDRYYHKILIQNLKYISPINIIYYAYMLNHSSVGEVTTDDPIGGSTLQFVYIDKWWKMELYLFYLIFCVELVWYLYYWVDLNKYNMSPFMYNNLQWSLLILNKKFNTIF